MAGQAGLGDVDQGVVRAVEESTIAEPGSVARLDGLRIDPQRGQLGDDDGAGSCLLLLLVLAARLLLVGILVIAGRA
jgi:hypothetical protein